MHQIKTDEMKTILIPTDLSKESLDLIKNAILNFPNQKIKIIMAYGLKTHISDFEPMNFLSSRYLTSELSNDFVNKKNRLQLEHSNQIAKIQIEVFTGTNSYAFKNFLMANEVTDAIIPKSKLRNFSSKNHFDLSDLINKQVTNVIAVNHPVNNTSNDNFKFKVSSILQEIKL